MKSDVDVEQQVKRMESEFSAMETRRKGLLEQRAEIDRELGALHNNMTKAANFREALLFALGKDINGNPLQVDAEPTAEKTEENKKPAKTKKPN